jgi:hypothetical protein
MRQANSVSEGMDELQMDLGCLSKTVPERQANTDDAYGDIYERLAVAASQRKAVQVFCRNCGADDSKARLTGRAYLNVQPTSASLVGLFTYRIAGQVLSPVRPLS